MSLNIFFLDTNILLDYIEGRDGEIIKLLDYMINISRNKNILIATSIINIAEVLDKNIEISFNNHCMTLKLTNEEAKKQKGNFKFYREISEKNRLNIENNLKKFIKKTNLEIFRIPCEDDLNELYNLLYDNCLQSQDAVIVSTALFNESDYFLTKDRELINRIKNKIYAYDLGDDQERTTFINSVLKSL